MGLVRLSLVALVVSTAHGFVVTAGPRRSASMSRPRHDIVAAADYDKCFAGPPCPPLRAPTHVHTLMCAHRRFASAGLSRANIPTLPTRTTSSATSRRRACTAHCHARACGGLVVPAGTPLTVPAPIFAQRMIRDMTGNKEYEFGDGSKALAEGSKEAAEKARGAPSAWYRSERARRSA